MNEAVHAPIAGWSDFYVIVGSAAAALTGLQFVVIALINDTRQRASEQTLAAFSTPSVVHFAMALLLSAIMTAPWPAVWHVTLAVFLCGAACFVYSLTVLHRARKQTQYAPVLEDWIWHVSLPIVAYALLAISAILLLGRHPSAQFAIAGAVLLLVFIGIHNAWDTVTYLALRNSADAGSRSSNRGE